MTQQQVRIGIVGLGNMGSKHTQHVIDLPNTKLVAICDRNPARLEIDDVPEGLSRHSDYEEMLSTAPLDAVIIATPHYDHPDMCLSAFERGLHVLVEKPIAVHVKEAERLISGYQHAKQSKPDLVFAAMFMQRTWGHWRAIKAMIDGGELGRLTRGTWLITDWFRTQHYYDSGDWRATWKGEGGGVLMNQCPHNLDLYQWLLGLPARAHGFVKFGKHHDIEVEDEVTAYFEHSNGAVGHFITTTGESPGTNRLEIVGELGKLVYEAGAQPLPDAADPDAAQNESGQEGTKAPDDLIFYRNSRSSIVEIQQSTQGFAKAPYTREVVPYTPLESHGHEIIIENFADAILHGAELIAPAEEGINMVMLNNAIMLSAHKRATVDLPIDGDEFAALLEQYIKHPPGFD
ncbi:MAG: Gfo/Idh/MocA family oxidoreductase [Chloroflexi bacterium]|nr:Gfo/Idh/MocA family oxidoreductase [Chloroflexota bacterium]